MYVFNSAKYVYFPQKESFVNQNKNKRHNENLYAVAQPI